MARAAPADGACFQQADGLRQRLPELMDVPAVDAGDQRPACVEQIAEEQQLADAVAHVVRAVAGAGQNLDGATAPGQRLPDRTVAPFRADERLDVRGQPHAARSARAQVFLGQQGNVRGHARHVQAVQVRRRLPAIARGQRPGTVLLNREPSRMAGVAEPDRRFPDVVEMAMRGADQQRHRAVPGAGAEHPAQVVRLRGQRAGIDQHPAARELDPIGIGGQHVGPADVGTRARAGHFRDRLPNSVFHRDALGARLRPQGRRSQHERRSYPTAGAMGRKHESIDAIPRKVQHLAHGGARSRATAAGRRQA